MGPKDPSNREKKHPKILFQPNCRKLQDDLKNVSLKIGSRGPKKLGPFFSLFLMRKPLSNSQKWFLRLIRGMFLSRGGLRYLIWALEVPEAIVRKRPLSLGFLLTRFGKKSAKTFLTASPRYPFFTTPLWSRLTLQFNFCGR